MNLANPIIRGKRPRKRQRAFRSSQGWRTVDGRRIYFRSGWEAKFAHYLTFLKKHDQIEEWFYEPQTFWFKEIKRGTVSYLPDFKIIRKDKTHYWVEVKGYMDAKSKTKIKRFRKYYPDEELQIVDSKWFFEQGEKIPMLGSEIYVD